MTNRHACLREGTFTPVYVQGRLRVIVSHCVITYVNGDIKYNWNIILETIISAESYFLLCFTYISNLNCLVDQMAISHF